LPSIRWERAGEAGWEKEFEVEELFPACPPSSSSCCGLEMLTSEEDFSVICAKELVGSTPAKNRSAFPSSLSRDGASGMA